MVGALVPDLNAIESKLKHVRVGSIKPLVPVARAINRDFRHRRLLHSLRGWVGWTILILPLGIVIGWLSVAVLSPGYASHLTGDACTRTGVPLLYPKNTKWHLLPRCLRIVTGSAGEEIVFVLAATFALMLLLTRRAAQSAKTGAFFVANEGTFLRVCGTHQPKRRTREGQKQFFMPCLDTLGGDSRHK